MEIVYTVRKMMYADKIKEVRDRLRDMQKATVEYVACLLYDKGQRRMLVADEVGLGKTWIAKGVIADGYERWCNEGHIDGESFKVYYICSNQQLIAQNLKQLNFTKDEKCIVSNVNRITMLALDSNSKNTPFQIYALTPDTSLSEKQGQGIKDERYMIYSILHEEKDFAQTHIASFLKGYDRRIEWKVKDNHKNVRPDVAEKFKYLLKNISGKQAALQPCLEAINIDAKISLWDILKEITSRNDRYVHSVYQSVIGALRKALTQACLDQMNANLFVMDEFQRYSQLLDAKEDNEQNTIAKRVFTQTDAKVLMLSATPFKAFTNSYDEQQGEHHYKELKRVLQFLYDGSDVDFHSFETARAHMFDLLKKYAKADNREEYAKRIQECKAVVEDFLSKVIVRTEKIIASKNPNGMVKECLGEPLRITKQEIADFINLDNVFRQIYAKKGESAPTPVDYAKSAPYAMSYLRDYKVGEKAENLNISLKANAFVDLNKVGNYKFPEGGRWPHAKLHLLMENIRKESRLLWCPPSLSYYPLEGAFRGQEAFSKTLVFSAWKLVPKMIATLVSYEAERWTVGSLSESYKVKYFVDKRVASQGDKARRPLRRLVFTKDKNNMTTFMLAYPCRSLIASYDPLVNLQIKKTKNQIIKEQTEYWVRQIKETCESQNEIEYENIENISWAFPLILDRDNPDYGSGWVKRLGNESSESILSTKYIEDASLYLTCKKSLCITDSPKTTELTEQSRNMALLSMGSPANCAYRTLKRYFENESDILACAFKIGLAFIDLFNKPESIAIVDLQYPNKNIDYWQKVLSYCVDGNLQAVLDEYVFMLLNDVDDVWKLTETICRILTMRTSTLKIDDARSFCQNESDDKDHKHSLRSHYAAAFGVKTTSSQGSEHRATNVREAFNSPFRPFVLATTSIGQEGLDFHWYCRKIMHWNLPNSPIDFEQREGRINRYRGKIIRQRIADKYKDVLEGKKLPWTELFELAESDKTKAKFPCDIVPNWHFDADENEVAIERIVPIYQFSQDIQRYIAMKRVLGMYRLTFGQPRQEELIEALDCELTSEEIDKLLIDLCPLRKQHNSQKKPSLK